MANQNVKVNLQFSADTSQAINNINSLKSLLNNIGSNTTIGINNSSIDKAVQSAQMLNMHLEKAVNVDTGKLDLTKLNTNLKQAGTNLTTLSNNITQLGPQGQQAFLKLATAVSQAEVPMYKMSKALSSMGTTLLNTIKWSIASAAVNAFTGAISGAISHAEALNTALNEIRIVTGYSTDYMSNFAAQASKAANALGTTTTEFAKAALIFYQQGLQGDAVMERAETVVKLANVTGQTAEQVSSQMTAIWNNFADGSETLEYYADVLTKLGAATAASTDEIAQAMEKFAATADVIGLSYETAAAAVATVVAETRQSADVVGTAFKTIFARIQGLELGETLEDGTTLNKYSQALNTVGIKILDTSGNMRKMDDILDDLGDKWTSLTDAQQAATAQTVAGTRQYTQFIAVMENWDKIQDNIKIAELSEGELTNQQQIWSESWEAASNRVKKAKDDLYESFLNDESIVKLNDVFASLINTVTKFIDSVGGIGPMLLIITAMLSKTLFPLMIQGFKNIHNFIGSFNGSGFQSLIATQDAMSKKLKELLDINSQLTQTERDQITVTKQLVDLKTKVALATKGVSESRKQEILNAMELYEWQNKLVQKSLEEKDAIEKKVAAKKQELAEAPNAKEMGEISALTKYRNNNAEKGIDDGYTDSIIDQVAHSDFQQIKTQANIVTNSGRKGLINQQTKNIENLQKEYSQVEKSTTFSSEDEQLEVMLELENKILAAEKERNRIQNLSEEEFEQEKNNLQEVYNLHKKIKEEQKNKDPNSLSFGKVQEDLSNTAKVMAQESPEAQENKNQYETITKTAIAKVQNFSDYNETKEIPSIEGMNLNNIEIESNIQNLQNLYQVLGEYEGKINLVNAILQENTNASNEMALANKQLKEAQNDLNTNTKKQAEIEGKLKTAKANKDKTQEKALIKELNKLKKEQIQIEKQVENAKKNVANTGEKVKKNYVEMEAVLKKLTSALGLGEKETKELDAAFKKIQSTNGAKGFKELETALKKLKGNLDLSAQDLKELGLSLQDAALKGGMTEEQVKELAILFQQLGLQSENAEQGLMRLGQTEEDIDLKTKGAKDGFANFTTGLTTAIGQISMAIGGIQMLNGAFEEGMSPLQSMTMLLSGLGMIIPSLVAAYFGLFGVKKLDNGETKKGIVLKAAEAVVAWAVKTAKDTETGSWIKNTRAMIASYIAALPIPVIMLAIVAAVALLAAAIIGLVAYFKALSDAYNADAIAAKEAAERVQEAEEAFSSAKEAAEDFKNTVSNWDEAIKSLEDLEEGTKEYTEALKEANEQAKEIINNHNLIKGIDWEYNDKGAIEFIKDEKTGKTALDRVQDNLDQAVFDTENNLTYSKINSNNKNLKNSRTQKARDLVGSGIYKPDDKDGDGIDDGRRALTDSEMTSIINQFTNDQTLGLDDTALQQMLQENLPDSLKSLSEEITKNRSAFEELAKSTDKVTKENDALADAYRQNLINQQYGDKAEKWATDKETGEVNEVKKDQALRALNTRIEKVEEEKNAELEDRLSDIDYEEASSNDNTIDFIENQGDAAIQAIKDLTGTAALNGDGGAINNDEELALTYAQMLAEQRGETLDRSTLTYVKGKNIGTVKDASGEELVDEVSDDVMRHEIAKWAARKQIEADFAEEFGSDSATGEQLENALDALITNGDKLGEEYGANFTGALLKTIEDGDGDIDLTSLFSELDPDEVAKLQKMSPEQLQKALGLSDEQLKTLGLGSAEEFHAAFGEGLEEYRIGDYMAQFEDIETQFKELYGIVGDLNLGDVISEEDYNTLIKYNAALEDYFVKTADGQYKLTTSQRTLHDMTIGGLKDKIEQMKEWSKIQQSMPKWTNAVTGEKTDWNKIAEEGGSESTLNNLKKATKTREALIAIGWTDEKIDNMDLEGLKKAATDLAALENSSETLQSLQEVLGSTAKSIWELDSSLQSGYINQEVYNSNLKIMAAEFNSCSDELLALTEAERLYGIESEEAKEAQERLNEAVKEAQYAEAAQNLSDYITSLNTLGETNAPENFQKIAEELTKIFEIEVSATWVEENIDLVNQYADRIQDISNQMQEVEEASKLKQLRINQENNKLKAAKLASDITQNKAYIEAGDEYSQSIEIQVLADTEQFEATLDKIAKTDREIRLAVTADLKSDFKQLRNFEKEFSQLQSYLREDLTITADEMQNIIASGNAAILQNVKVTADGRMQLDKGVVKSFTENRATELKASVETQVKELQAKREVLVALKEINTKRLEQIEKFLNSEDSAEKEAALAELGRLDIEYDEKHQVLEDLLTEEEDAKDLEVDNETMMSEFKAEVLGLDLENTETAAEQGMQIDYTRHQYAVEYWNRMSEAAANYNKIAKDGSTEFTPTEPYEPPPALDIAGSTEFKSAGQEIERPDFKNGEDLKETRTEGEAKENAEKKFADIEEEMEARKKDILADIASLDEQIGIIDSSITMLESSITSFENAYNNAGSETSGGGNDGGDDGGGGGDTPEAKELFEIDDDKLKKLDDEIERYRTITNYLETINSQLSMQSKIKDRLYGKSKIKAMEKELEILDKQIEAQRQYIKEIDEKLKIDGNKISEKYGVTFDQNGDISNYEQVIEKLAIEYDAKYIDIMARKNEAVNAYNNSARDEAAEKIYDKAIEDLDEELENIEEYYQEALEDINLYDETFDLSKSEREALADMIYAQMDAVFEKMTYSIQIEVELDEFSIEIIDAKLKALEDNFYTALERSALLSEKTASNNNTFVSGAQLFMVSKNQYENGKISLDKYVENLKIAKDWIISGYQGLLDQDEAFKNIVQGSLDDFNEELSFGYEKIASCVEKLQFMKNILGLIGQSENYEAIGMILEEQVSIAKTEAEIAVKERNNAQSRLDEVLEQLNDPSLTDGDRKALEETRDMLITDVINKEKNAQQKLVALGEVAREEIDNTLKGLRDALEREVTGGILIEDLQTSLDRVNARQEEYLTKTNQLYETNKLIRKAQIDMDKAENSQTKQRYKDYIKYIEQLRERGKLSNFELEIAQKEFELLQAKIALEDAQNAKNTVRLSRDVEGNWGYIYTADEDKTAEAEQNVYDLQNEMYNLSLEAEQKYKEKYIQILQESFDTYAQINEDYLNGRYKTKEEYDWAMYEAQQHYNTMLQDTEDIYNLARETSYGIHLDTLSFKEGTYYGTSLSDLGTHYNNMASASENSWKGLDSIVTAHSKTEGDLIHGLGLKISGLGTTTDSVMQSIDEYLNGKEGTGGCTQAFEKWKTDISLLIYEIGGDLTGAEGKDGLKKKIEDIGDAADGVAEKILDPENGLLKAFQDIWANIVYNTIPAWGDLKTVIDGAKSAYQQYLDLINSELGDAAGEEDPPPPNIPNPPPPNDYQYTPDNEENLDDEPNYAEDQGEYTYVEGYLPGNEETSINSDPLTILEHIHKGWAPNGVDARRKYFKEKKFSVEVYEQVQQALNDSVPGDGSAYDYYRTIELLGFDTGGYTGAWGPEGKLAMLHEKELVLNAEDTSNFLTAISMLRSISELLDQNALMTSLGLSSLQAFTLSQSNAQTLQQEVTIHAEFPNVQDHNEIELALADLVNAASQYANRK